MPVIFPGMNVEKPESEAPTLSPDNMAVVTEASEQVTAAGVLAVGSQEERIVPVDETMSSPAPHPFITSSNAMREMRANNPGEFI